MWHLEIGLAMFWLSPIFLGIVVALILLRFSNSKLRSGEPGDTDRLEPDGAATTKLG